MARTSGTDSILAAAARWRDRCLLLDGSVFGDRRLWTIPVLAQLETYYVHRLDYGEGDFLTKLRQQLAPSSADAKRLAAEMLWVMFLFPSNIGKARKVEVVRTIWSWSGDEVAENHPMFEAFAKGIGSGGPGFNNYRWLELVVLIRWVQAWKGLDPSVRVRLIGDPWEFAEWLDAVPGAAKRQLRHMILHLLFPENFERVSSADNKRLIEKAFRKRLPSADLSETELEPTLVGQDRRLLRIRHVLEAEHPNTHVDFYEGEFWNHWRKDVGGVSEPPIEEVTGPVGGILPPSSREQILDAMKKFDSDLRGSAEWNDWESNMAHLYAISDGTRLYPVKQIISIATGVPRSDFSGGEPANRYIRQYGFQIVRLRESEMGKTWIFQANADRYDIQTALASLREMHWLVQQHKAEIHAGDRVFIWQSGAHGGIVAEARVVTEPSLLPQSTEEAKYWTNASDAVTSNALRVGIEIENIVTPPISRSALQSKSELSELSILKFSQGTNFPVTDREAAVIAVMMQENQTQPRTDAAYWCIAPAEGARLWNDFVEAGIAAIGWDQLGDLNNFGSKEDIVAALKNNKPGEGEPINDALACYQFAKSIRTGDVILAKRGVKEIIGYGIVTSSYEFRPDRAEYRNVRQVNWVAVGSWMLPPEFQLPLKTLTEVSNYERLLGWLLPLVRCPFALRHLWPQPELFR